MVPFLLFSCSKQINPGLQWLGEDAITTKTGISYIYLKHGDGPKIEHGMRLETMIILKVGDSTEVWNTRKTQEPFIFRFRYENMISGFDEVISYAHMGDRIKAILPPKMGYGWEGSGHEIPPNAYLSFDVEIISAKSRK
jgi:FKBP-type peptidyl-prolyl cis-trans isomerase